MTMTKKLFVLLLILMSLIGLSFADENPLIRVWLHRLNFGDVAELKATHSFSVMAEDSQMVIKPNVIVKIFSKHDELYLYANGVSVKLGKKATLFREHQDVNCGFIFHGSENIYSGNLEFSLKDDAIFGVLYSPLESYLLGVVPYEMSDSFPLEALKAQAIAARTYTVKRLNANKSYDVEDTTNDQVYKGFNPKLLNAKLAVDETKGKVLSFNGNVADVYYSASNGGQTEIPKNKWGKDAPMYVIKDDIYDYNNPNALVKTLSINKKDPKLKKAFLNIIAKALETQMNEANFEQGVEHIRIDEIESLSLGKPCFEKPSKVMCKLNMVLKFSGKRRIAEPSEPTATPLPTPTPFIYTFIKPKPTPYIPLSEFIPYGKSVSIRLPIFDGALKAMGLNLNGGGKEILELSENEQAFVIKSRRFGHGIGLSQRGAESMAKDGKNVNDILNFYFPQSKIMNLDTLNIKTSEETVESLNINNFTVPQASIKKTPKPTPIPLLWAIPKGIQLATVKNIAEDSYLNLREEPNANSAVVCKLYYGQKLVVESVEDDGEWVKVCLNKANPNEAFEGYVAKEFIEIEP